MRKPHLDLWNFDRIKFQVKIAKVSAGKHHCLALGADRAAHIYSWGSGSFGQLGHGDYDDAKYPRAIKEIPMEGVDIMAVGDTSVALDSLNNLMTWGSNHYGELGTQAELDNRELPGKLARKYLNYNILILRSYYSQSGESTLSFMNELGEIYVWGRFLIPYNGNSKNQ